MVSVYPILYFSRYSYIEKLVNIFSKFNIPQTVSIRPKFVPSQYLEFRLLDYNALSPIIQFLIFRLPTGEGWNALFRLLKVGGHLIKSRCRTPFSQFDEVNCSRAAHFERTFSHLAALFSSPRCKNIKV